MGSISDHKKKLTETIGDSESEAQARPWDDQVDAGWQAELAHVRTIVAEFSQPGRLLELTLGDYQWSALLAQRSSVITLDYYQNGWQHLRAGSSDERSLGSVRADVFQLPFQSDSFDRCFCGFWLGLIPREEIVNFIAELSRVVRSGGRVLFVDTFRPAREDKDNTRGYFTPEALRVAIWPFAEDVEVFRTRNFFVVANYVVRNPRHRTSGD